MSSEITARERAEEMSRAMSQAASLPGHPSEGTDKGDDYEHSTRTTGSTKGRAEPLPGVPAEVGREDSGSSGHGVAGVPVVRLGKHDRSLEQRLDAAEARAEQQAEQIRNLQEVCDREQARAEKAERERDEARSYINVPKQQMVREIADLTATVARVKELADEWDNPLHPCFGYVDDLRAALDGGAGWMTTEPRLEHRYVVHKINDPTGKHDDCRYFVLDPQHDPIAREALTLYAGRTPSSALRRDLYDWLDSLAALDGGADAS